VRFVRLDGVDGSEPIVDVDRPCVDIIGWSAGFRSGLNLVAGDGQVAQPREFVGFGRG